MNAIVKAPLVGEIIEPGETVFVTAAMHPFRSEPTRFEMPAGSSLDEIVNEAAARDNMPSFVNGACVEINSLDIDPFLWPRVRVKAGMHVFVRARARGSVFKTVLSLALAVLAAFVAGPAGIAVLGTFGAAIAGTAIIVGGTLLLNALFPPASLKTSDKDFYSIGGTRNEVSKWGPIPVVLGKIRVAPKFAAQPYTEFVDDDQYVRNLYTAGQGPLALSDPMLGDTKITEYKDYQLEVLGGFANDPDQTLFPSEIVQEDFALEITQKNSPHERGVPDDGVEIQFDLLAPQGVVNVQTKSGKKKKLEVKGTASLVNEKTGAVAATIPWDMSDNDNNPKRKTFRFPGLTATKDLKLSINRASPDYDDEEDSDHYDNITLTAIRAFRNSPPIKYRKPISKIALRIKATKQLNGNPDNLTFMAESLAPIWTGSAWQMNQKTQNCASLALLVIMGQGAPVEQTFASIDQASWIRFYQYCELYGFKFNMYRDFKASSYDALSQVLAAGRAVRINVDGRIGVSFEDPSAPIKQFFTPRNSSDFRLKITYQDMPHGLRCKFVNETKDYKEDEKLVYFDGYGPSNATDYVQVEFPGVTDPDLIYKHARYRIAEMILRSRVITLKTDFEHIVLNRGDRASVTHDILQKEIVPARILSRTALPGGGYKIVIDETFTQEAGVTYGVTCRRDDGSISVYGIDGFAGSRNSFSIPAADFQSFKEGQLVTFGVLGRISATYRVLEIRKQSDLGAQIDFVDDAPGIMQADNGPVPGDPGVVVIPPPLGDYRPYGLSVSQFLLNETGFVSQVTRVIWKMKPGGPAMASFLVVATDDDGKEYRGATADGVNFSFDFINLPTGNYYLIVQGFTADGLYTGFSTPPVRFIQTLPEDSLGFDFEQLATEIQKQMNTVFAELDDRLNLFKTDITDDLDALAREAAQASVKQEKQERMDADGALATRVDTATAAANSAAARVRDEATARANEDGALSQRISTALATAQNAAAGVQNEATARANGDNSLASNINGVLARTNQVSAEGLVWMQAIGNGPNGLARFSVNLRAGESSNWIRTGFVMEAGYGSSGVSRVFFQANQFAVSTGSSEYTPFFIQDGRVYMDTAFIRELHATKIIAGTITATQITVGGVDVYRLAQGAATSLGISEGQNETTYTMQMIGGTTQIWTQILNSTGANQTVQIYASGVLFLQYGAAGETEVYQDSRGNNLTRRRSVQNLMMNHWGFSPGTYAIRAVCSGCTVRLSLLNGRR